MLYAVLVGSYICSFDTWRYYISIFIRFVYIEKHIPFHCLNQFHFPKPQEHLGNCIYLCSGCCDIPLFPIENKEIITPATGSVIQAALHLSVSLGTASAEESCLISQGHAPFRVACIQ